MIEAKGISLIYPDSTIALKNISTKIETGKVVYITGPSGSGKTSLLKLLMGVEFATGGSLQVLGYQMKREHQKNIQILRTFIGPVFQEFRLIKGRTVFENVMTGMRFLDLPNAIMKENALEALIHVGLKHKLNSKVENLSWGESQRVAIARAVARKPVLILADEPTGNLDRDNAINILELLTSYKDKNTTVIITTHATHLIEDNIEAAHIRMDKGSIVPEGTVIAK